MNTSWIYMLCSKCSTNITDNIAEATRQPGMTPFVVNSVFYVHSNSFCILIMYDNTMWFGIFMLELK